MQLLLFSVYIMENTRYRVEESHTRVLLPILLSNFYCIQSHFEYFLVDFLHAILILYTFFAP
ncbi:hypothetical protein MXB_3296 [Myxobolus squamalis]|nr:hypothetical protein MXB_3296 [Myxobolus squamalis]